ncbi:MAG: hypothetical protein HONBIEJF_01782 [Fimbriimonadaceae bacterium]|nr:hypothetical protein [Fimbriimonadaceae bacterium]
MKHIAIIAATAALVLVGCGKAEESAGTNSESSAATTATDVPKVIAVAYDAGTKKVGDKGSCAVCTIQEGKVSDDEEVKDVLDYNGKTYVFCAEGEKADFISDPKKYTGGK